MVAQDFRVEFRRWFTAVQAVCLLGLGRITRPGLGRRRRGGRLGLGELTVTWSLAQNWVWLKTGTSALTDSDSVLTLYFWEVAPRGIDSLHPGGAFAA